MILPTLNRTVLRWALAQIAQLDRDYDSKTGQSGQTGHRLENAQELHAVSGRKARSYDPRLASRTVHRPIPAACGASRRIGAAHAHPHGAPAP
jgi:hypothetical protein